MAIRNYSLAGLLKIWILSRNKNCLITSQAMTQYKLSFGKAKIVYRHSSPGQVHHKVSSPLMMRKGRVVRIQVLLLQALSQDELPS
jgi:hypothetical protein